ncbi:MAG: class I SAM-dependent methyltransferase [Spirochaetes bacterium]|nr:class I SAM-dependent methyltransferase [Spirochaetota bacterium]
MIPVMRAAPLYRFYTYCQNSELPKNILDCGAGGNNPPLSFFKSAGFDTKGIEFSKDALKMAKSFQQQLGIDLNIEIGDMRKLDFADQTFSFTYSYNSVFHLTKEEIQKAITEMFRVTKTSGWLFLNFLSVDDPEYGAGEVNGPGEYVQLENGDQVIHTYFEDEEAENLFPAGKIHYKEKRIVYRLFNNHPVKQVYLDYIIQKK